MRRDYIFAGIFWIALTLLLELYYPTVRFFGTAASEEGLIIDDTFNLLVYLAIPVFSFVVSILIYSVLRFRVADDDLDDIGASHQPQSTTKVYIVWTIITSVLAIGILINPGISGIIELRSNPTADLVIEVTAEKWNWDFAYPQYGIVIEDATGGDVFVLPVDTRIKFEVNSLDILHSFWIPAFRMKIDAVPGLTTYLYLTTSSVGTFDEDINFRVQCAELCGSGHARMRVQVVVMEQADFDAWVAENQ